MNLVIICGPPASGKMTVGRALQKLTGYKLFHNHLSLELVNQFFDFGTANFKRLDKKIRFDVFEEVAVSDLKGLIFTMVWAFNEQEDEDYIDQIVSIFQKRNPTVSFIELECELIERLQRNRHETRLLHKPSKRDVKASEKRLLANDKKYRTNTIEGDVPSKSILKINNTLLTAEQVALNIKEYYKLKSI